MRFMMVVLCLSACVARFPTTRVTLFDRSEVKVEGAGKLPETLPNLIENDVVLAGRSSDVLAFDGDKLRMKLIEGCGYRRRCTPLELDVDTPPANGRPI